VTFGDTVSLALRNLRQAKLRTSLTTLGVSIGIASLSGMVSLGVGLQDQFVGRFTRSGMFDSISVTSAADLPGFMAGGGLGPGRGGGRGRRGGRPAPEARPLNDETIKEIAALEHVREVYPNLRMPLEVTLDGEHQFTIAAGVPMSAKDIGSFQTMTQGRFFAQDSADECMLSLDMARRLSEKDPKELVGSELTLTYAAAPPSTAAPPASVEGVVMQVQRVDAKYRIVGIVERETGPGPGGASVSPVMIPMGKARDIYARLLNSPRALMNGLTADRAYASVTVKVTAPQRTQDVQAKIRSMGYSAFSLNDALQGAKRAFIILDIVLSLIGSIALAVASLGIVNTMVMSILERTREIGIMKAIGGSDGDVRRIFLIEASLIGVAGGVAGLMLGWLVGRIINFGANQYIVSQGGAPGNLFSLPYWLIGGAIGFAIVVSLLAGSYPANRAARLDPIQALRHD
jgi:putative ABC transport system permease protein